jgi:hypothetical protein
MASCKACENEVPAGTPFCTSCGARLAGSPSASPVDCAVGDPKSRITQFLVWNRKIPLITNPYLVLQCLLIPSGIGIGLGVLFAVIIGDAGVMGGFSLIGLALGVLFLLILLVLQLATGGLETEFYISDRGVAHNAGRTTRLLNRASTGGSAALGSMGGTGAGMLAQSQEENLLFWEDVCYVSVYPRVRSLVFRSRYLINPVVLYCTEENFSAVQEMAKKYAPEIVGRKI